MITDLFRALRHDVRDGTLSTWEGTVLATWFGLAAALIVGLCGWAVYLVAWNGRPWGTASLVVLAAAVWAVRRRVASWAADGPEDG